MIRKFAISTLATCAVLYICGLASLSHASIGVTCEHDFIPKKETAGLESLPRHSVNITNLVPATMIKEKNNLRAKSYEMDFKILILSSEEKEKDDPGLQAAISFLQNMWIPFDVVNLVKGGKRNPNAKLELLNHDGSAKYSGVITSEFNLSYKTLVNGKSQYVSALTKEEWQLLFDYEKKFDVRHVSLFTYPQESVGVEAIQGADNYQERKITFNKEILGKYSEGYNLDIEIPIKNNWHYPVRVLPGSQKNTFPIASFSGEKPSVAGVLHKLEDGREQMHFFFSQSKTSFISKFFSPIWIKWLTKNIYTGKRRAYLTAQIDDYLTPTKLWHPNPQHKRAEYRTSVQDIKTFVDFQDSYLRKETKDSDYKIEMAFNGKGIVLYGGVQLDPLSNFSMKNSEAFNWVSHTYSHPELNDITYNEMVQEIRNNTEAIKFILKEDSYLFSEYGFVTPRISGLYNPEALRALYDNNISHVIGDNTKEDFRSPKNKHHMRATTKKLNGFEGTHIVPRFPTDIFYHVSTLDELEQLFNHLYEISSAKAFDYKKIFEKNAKEAAANLLEFDYSPYMFHQANMRLIDVESKSESLLSLWFKAVLTEYRKYSNLPLKSLSFNELIKVYNERKTYDECNFSARLVVENKKLTEIKLNSKDHCVIPITGLSEVNIVAPNIAKFEEYGPDNTVYVKLHGSEISLFINSQTY